ncbi:hypothetical protein [Serratia sp. AKBS12]|nr:hypothetical protein [Serratia sp. AKBS12]MCS3406535.1 hypothetical protein [Serratia sp. AKBS12]
MLAAFDADTVTTLLKPGVIAYRNAGYGLAGNQGVMMAFCG